MSDRRLIIFDLDDTLYPRSTFVLSGFRAVAERLERTHALPAQTVFHVLREAFERGDRGRELQQVCSEFALPPALIPSLVEVIRDHTPAIHLPELSIRVLRWLRYRWRIGVLTNGLPRVQKKKIAALGLLPLVDAVVYAAECGDGAGKPAAAGFTTILETLGGTPEATIFVGDDPHADIAGAASLGMKTIQIKSVWTETVPEGSASACVTSLAELPPIVEHLIPWRAVAHVA